MVVDIGAGLRRVGIPLGGFQFRGSVHTPSGYVKEIAEIRRDDPLGDDADSRGVHAACSSGRWTGWGDAAGSASSSCGRRGSLGRRSAYAATIPTAMVAAPTRNATW